MVKEKKLVMGINEDCSNDFYHSDREFSSSSVLKTILRDPQKYYEKYILGTYKDKGGDHFDFGSLVHAMILEPHIVDDEFAFYKGPVKRGKAFESFKEENEGKIIIGSSQKLLADTMVKSFNLNPYAPSFIKDAVFEETVCTEINGLKIKVRTDSRQGTNIGDVKTTGSGVSFEECINTCIQWDYDLSAALYCDVLEKVRGEKHDFYFFFISKRDGQAKTFKASEQFLENGRRKYLDAIELIKQGRESGDWLKIIKETPIKELKMPDTHVWHRIKGDK
jgi:hypothetical protein